VKIAILTLTWQDFGATVVVLLAAGYVVWRIVRFLRRKGMPTCGGCQSCACGSVEKVLVTLSTPKMKIPDDPGRRGVVGIVVREGRMLVIRRSRTVVAPLVYCFPGGGIDGAETEEEALTREFMEEIGVVVRPVRRLWHCVTAWKVDLAWWLAEMAPDATPVANPAEVESIHWYTPEEMAALPDLLDSNREFLDLVRKSPLLLQES
jgi:8-oxo-dGTP diphosphatase